jgi:hypothetical protein
MTPEDWWRIGARLLGTYFLVLGALYAAGAIAAVGVGLPDGSNRLAYVSMPVFQALIAGGGGLLLIRRSAVVFAPTARPGPVARGYAFVSALQLLGVFFLVGGAAELLRVLIDSCFTGAGWQFRSSQVASGLVQVVAGTLLALAPQLVAAKLIEFGARASNKPLQPTSDAEGVDSLGSPRG